MNIAQNMLSEIFKHHEIISPAVQDANNLHLLQESEIDSELYIPHGIPDLFEYSELRRKEQTLDENAVATFLEHLSGKLPELGLPELGGLVVMACVVIYLLRPIIGPLLSSAWRKLSRHRYGRIGEHSLPETVSIPVAELNKLREIQITLQVCLDEFKTRQEDMLTAFGESEDYAEQLEDEVQKLKQQIIDDATHHDAWVQGLNSQIGFEKDEKEGLRRERDTLRSAGRDLKKKVRELKADVQKLQDDRDEQRENAQDVPATDTETERDEDDDEQKERVMELQRELYDMTEARDNLQTRVDQLEMENRRLQSPLQVGEPRVAADSVDEGAPLRRVKSAPLWLPTPHHGDTFDPLYDVSDYGDDDGDESHSPKVPEKSPSSESTQKDGQRTADLPVLEPPPKPTFIQWNGKAYESIPSVGLERPLPSILTHDQAQVTSQQEDSSSDQGRSTSLARDNTSFSKAAGPGSAKNAHIRKLNKEVKRLDWRRKSGMPHSVEDEEGVAAPDDVLGKDSSLASSEIV